MAQLATQVCCWDMFNSRRLAEDKSPVPPIVLNLSFILNTTIGMDYIKVVTEREIEAWRIRSFDSFLVTVRVDAPITAGPVYNRNGGFVGHDTYVFEWRGMADGHAETLRKTMKVQMRSNGTVKIEYRGRWTPLSDFLKDLKIPYAEVLPSKQRSLDVQCNWWKANGKVFKLMALPVELRDLIYQFGFGPQVEPYPTSKTRRIGGNIGALEAIKARKPTSGLLLLNRQIGEEASHALYLYTTFFVQHKGIFHRLMSNVHTRPLLRRIELALPHHEFINLFGYQASGDDAKDRSMAVTIMPQLKLSCLELVFAPPPNKKDILDIPCQRSVVSLILSSAWPWVRGQPVKLGGWIKDRQERVFEAACLVERKRFDVWRERNCAVGLPEGSLLEYHDWVHWEETEEHGGVSLTGNSKSPRDVVEPREEEEALPLNCHCAPMCTQETWMADD
ncbi:hypothetical protein EJ03DRAFT_326849 [Teratosphaeria nubilosa]|uniref:Uncharacterized protein n=1 Tax=Teratosphaeria nubilosa TaxID=161662 RepID=A0A6G1LBH6_9PEZI|nr:hypothetical protein EJ03DRAFT_326849 [Teratosphaeria nubilosa]